MAAVARPQPLERRRVMNPFDRMSWGLRRAVKRGVRVRLSGIRPRQVVGAVLIALCLAGMQDLRARGFGHPMRTATIRSLPGTGLNPFSLEKSLEIELLGAQTVELTVRDGLGVPIRTFARHTYPAGKHRIHWDGRRDDGHEARPGLYTLDVDFGGTRSESRLAWVLP